MKSSISIILSACVAVAVMSCNDTSTTDSTTTDSASNTYSTTDTSTARADNTAVVTVEAPAPVRTTFETKYKDATNVTWRMYTPVSTTTPMDEWDYYYDLDTSYYQVNYNWNDLDYMAWYNPKGDWIKSYTKMENNSGLPDAINKVINSKFNGYKITEIEIEDRKKGMSYEVDLESGTDKKKVVFSPSGAILKQKDK